MVRTLADLNSGNNQGPQGPAGNPFSMGRMGRDFEWKSIPTGFYVLSLTSLAIMVLTLFTGLGGYLINVPVLTVLKLQIWRVFFCYLVCPEIFSLIFSLLIIFSLSMTEESRVGTGRFMLQLFWKNFFVQLGVVVVGMLLYLLFSIETIFSFNIWPVYFVFLTIQCWENPEGVTFFCMMPCPIKNRYYPLLLLAFFTILSGKAPVDLFIGFGLGALATRYVVIKTWFEPSEKWARKMQDVLMRFDGSLGRVVPIEEGAREGPFGNQAPQPRPEDNRPGAATAEIVRPIFGGTGRAIGGVPSNSIFTNYDHLDKQPKPQPSTAATTTVNQQTTSGQQGLTLGDNDPKKKLDDSL